MTNFDINTDSNIDWDTKEKQDFLKAILSLENKNQAKCFLRDLLTGSEIEEFSKRLLVANLLSSDVQYNTIIEETGLSSTTIARISRWLKRGTGGYKTIISKLHHHNPTKLRKGLS